MNSKLYFYWLILLCSVRFFDLSLFGETLNSNFDILGALLLVCFNIRYHKSVSREDLGTSNLILMLLFGALGVSSISSFYFNGQPILYSFIASRVLLYYLFYRALLIIRPSNTLISKSILIIAGIHFMLFLIQFVIYPNKILLSFMEPDRASVRIRMPGRAFIHFTALWSFSYFINDKNRDRIQSAVIWLGSFLIVVLAVTRSIIISILLGFVSLLLKFQKRRIVFISFIGVLIAAGLVFVISSIDPKLVSNMISVSVDNSQQGDESLRALAINYYYEDVLQRPLAFVLGNGNPTGGENFKSAYSLKSNYERDLGFYLDDLGLFGTVYRYGLIYLLFVVTIFWKVYSGFRLIPTDTLQFIKVYFLFLLVLIFLIDFFAINTDSITIICISLYIIETEVKRAKLQLFINI
jgi:hypothetical protein